MHTPPVGVPAQLRGRRAVEQPSLFFRGLAWGLVLSVPLWGALVGCALAWVLVR